MAAATDPDGVLPCPFEPSTHEERTDSYACPWCGCPIERGTHVACVPGCRRDDDCSDCGHLVYYHSQGACWHDDNCACGTAPTTGLYPWDVGMDY